EGINSTRAGKTICIKSLKARFHKATSPPAALGMIKNRYIIGDILLTAFNVSCASTNERCIKSK
ncbi:14477_t:CDS:2, partial [Acaulospora morrowiae]